MILGAYMLYMAGRCSSIEQGGELIQEALHSGRGADKFRKMIHAQGGDQRAADDPSLLPLSDNVIPIKAEQAGYIYSIDARGVGQAAHILGAGRSTKEDPIDHSVGIVLSKRMGEMVRRVKP